MLVNARLAYISTEGWYMRLPNDAARDPWTGEVSADKWVPVFPVFLLAVGIMKKIFCLYKNDLF